MGGLMAHTLWKDKIYRWDNRHATGKPRSYGICEWRNRANRIALTKVFDSARQGSQEKKGITHVPPRHEAELW